jgi:hypothetical protein
MAPTPAVSRANHPPPLPQGHSGLLVVLVYVYWVSNPFREKDKTKAAAKMINEICGEATAALLLCVEEFKAVRHLSALANLSALHAVGTNRPLKKNKMMEQTMQPLSTQHRAMK